MTFFYAEFYRVVWTINALLTVHSDMLPFSINNQNIKMFGFPPNTLPYVMYMMIICHWTILHYNMPFQTIAGRSDGVFWWFPALSEDQEKKIRIHQYYLVALTYSQMYTTISVSWFQIYNARRRSESAAFEALWGKIQVSFTVYSY